MIVRGAVESVVELCSDIKKEKLADILLWSGEQGKKGRRTIAIASRACPVLKNYAEKEEQDLHFIGVISFVDPIKDSTKSAITHAEHLGVKIKIITGDSREVAGAVA
jgi:magnesium-transporting ATPase (P-type)